MRLWKKGICLAVCLCLLFALPMAARADYTNALIQEKEAEIEDAQQQVDSLQSSLTDVEALKKQLESSKSDLNAYVTQLDAELNTIQEKIEEYNALIADKEEEIRVATADLEEAQATQEEQYEAMKERIKFMYEKGDALYLDFLFSGESFAEGINKADYIEALSAYDRKKLEEYAQTSEYIALCKEELEAEKEVLDEAYAAAEAEGEAVNTLMAEKEAQIVSVSADISNKEAAIAEYEAMIAEQNEEIEALEKAIEAEKARLAAEAARKYDGGIFAWPCPAYTRVSDDYGYRIHPILGVEQFHNGVDLAAPYGSAILAAYDGDVVAASYSSSMGNYIMLDHGSGLYTIYMHASALYVTEGQAVAKGQTIAAVGSTGRSTGNHLHFSVRLNGEYVNPWDYIS